MSKSSRVKRRIALQQAEVLRNDGSVVTASPDQDSVRAIPVAVVPRPPYTLLIPVVILLSLLVLGNYARLYDSQFGWSKLDAFGEYFAKNALPRVQRTPHYITPGLGMDGQFYAQMAIDPSVQDSAFDLALDNPIYRARRVGLPAIAFCLGWAKPRRVLQAYALTNLIFWFVLLGALIPLFRPWSGRQVLCLATGLLSFGCLASMQASFVDLPAAAMIFVGLTIAPWGRYTAFAVATLTRETSVLAALGSLDLRRPFTGAVWMRNLGLLALASVPFALWMLYIRHRFNGLQNTGGVDNFSLPLVAIWARFYAGIQYFLQTGLDGDARASGPFGWLYLDYTLHEVLTVLGIFCQGLYLAVRWNPQSAIWRTGICFAVLGCILGPAVWGWTGAAARVLLPMTLCYYLLVAKERDAWFWPFFVLGSLSVPFAVHEFWVFS